MKKIYYERKEKLIYNAFREAELAAEVWMTIEEVFIATEANANILEDESGGGISHEGLLQLEDILKGIQIIGKERPNVVRTTPASKCVTMIKAMKSGKTPAGRPNELITLIYLVLRAATIVNQEIDPMKR